MVFIMKYNKPILISIVFILLAVSAVIALGNNKESANDKNMLIDLILRSDNISIIRTDKKLLSINKTKKVAVQKPKSGEEVLEGLITNGKPSIIYFTSDYCRDCQQVKPVIKKLEDSYKDKINFLTVDIRENSSLNKAAIRKYRVFGVPLVVFIKKDGTKQKIINSFNPIDTYKNQTEILLKD